MKLLRVKYLICHSNQVQASGVKKVFFLLPFATNYLFNFVKLTFESAIFFAKVI